MIGNGDVELIVVPAVGRIVHYWTPEGPVAAIITKVWSDDELSLATFHWERGVGSVISCFRRQTENDFGRWDWPERR